jgi:DUF2914 family protein
MFNSPGGIIVSKLGSMLAGVALLSLPLVLQAEGLQVVDAKLGKGVQDRQITEEATTFAVNDKVYLWLKIAGGPADGVKVNWKLGDKVEPYTLKVGGNPWRTYASKTAYKPGEWTVTVTDANDQVLKEMKFTVQ